VYKNIKFSLYTENSQHQFRLHISKDIEKVIQKIHSVKQKCSTNSKEHMAFTSHKTHMLALISFFLSSARYQFTLQDHGYEVKTTCLCPTGSHCAYPWRDGQAELTWVAIIKSS